MDTPPITEDERRINSEIALGYMGDVKKWLLQLLEAKRITRQEYEFQYERLNIAQCSIDYLVNGDKKTVDTPV